MGFCQARTKSKQGFLGSLNSTSSLTDTLCDMQTVSKKKSSSAYKRLMVDRHEILLCCNFLWL